MDNLIWTLCYVLILVGLFIAYSVEKTKGIKTVKSKTKEVLDTQLSVMRGMTQDVEKSVASIWVNGSLQMVQELKILENEEIDEYKREADKCLN